MRRQLYELADHGGCRGAALMARWVTPVAVVVLLAGIAGVVFAPDGPGLLMILGGGAALLRSGSEAAPAYARMAWVFLFVALAGPVGVYLGIREGGGDGVMAVIGGVLMFGGALWASSICRALARAGR